jgi:Ni,Fe-hydrogenase I cytochrome b subunit
LLAARIVLFFQQGNSHFSRYKISLKDTQTIKDTLKFYLSLARAPLPSWHAFNPVWRILYALYYGLLVVMTFSGLVGGESLWLGLYWPPIHQLFASFIYIWLALHLLAVLIHDWKGKVGRISAMLSGVAYFESDSGVNDLPHENVIQTSFDLSNKK